MDEENLSPLLRPELVDSYVTILNMADVRSGAEEGGRETYWRDNISCPGEVVCPIGSCGQLVLGQSRHARGESARDDLGLARPERKARERGQR